MEVVGETGIEIETETEDGTERREEEETGVVGEIDGKAVVVRMRDGEMGIRMVTGLDQEGTGEVEEGEGALIEVVMITETEIEIEGVPKVKTRLEIETETENTVTIFQGDQTIKPDRIETGVKRGIGMVEGEEEVEEIE